MKIALIYEKFVSRGGLENYLFSLAKELQSQGHELQIVTAKTDGETEKLGLETHRIDLPASKSRRLVKFSREAARLAQSLAVDVSIGFGKTVAQDIHRAGGGCHLEYSKLLNAWKRHGRKNRLELKLERDLYTSGKTKHFVVNSEAVQDQVQSAYNLTPDQFSIIHTAVDGDRFKPAEPETRSALREKIARDPERPAFLFVSMSHRRKGLDALLKAWHLVVANHDAELWIVGPRPLRRHIREVHRLNLTDNIRVFPPSGSVVPYYQAADFFIHPTLYDACANTVLQSMACGLPGIISARDGAIQFIEDGSTGFALTDPQDVSGIQAQADRVLALSTEERARIGDAARSRMLPLTWSNHVDRWMQVIAKTAR